MTNSSVFSRRYIYYLGDVIRPAFILLSESLCLKWDHSSVKEWNPTPTDITSNAIPIVYL